VTSARAFPSPRDEAPPGAAPEACRPIPLSSGSGRIGRLALATRRVIDLQLCTVWRFISPSLSAMNGDVLDVGCGEMPFRYALPAAARYTGIDVPEAISFGMGAHADIVPFDGHRIPFADASFDHILCTEVLEHSLDPQALVDEMLRVLRPGGELVATIPFSARVHHAPYDFCRFTRYQLARMFAGFGDVEIVARGSDLSAIANKLVVLGWRLARPSWGLPLRLPALACVGLMAAVFLPVAHLSILLDTGSKDDPLGYGIRAVKGRG
jgi:SAM-dependent methyltransferase